MQSETKSTTLRLLQIEGDEEAPQTPVGRPEPESSSLNDAALAMLLTALKALSQRFIVALASLQVTLAIGSVLFLAYNVLLPAPNITQVSGVAIYAIFVLLALWLARK